MRSRVPLLVLLGSALAFLASLYLPWRSGPAGGGFNGWDTVDGSAGALVAVALAVAAAVALLRPGLAARLPFGGLGVGLAFFVAAVAVQVHEASALPPPPGTAGWTGSGIFGLQAGWAYGVYPAIACGAVAGATVLGCKRRELLRRRPASDAAAAALGLGVLVSFLLPWFGTSLISRPGSTAIGLDSPAATIAAGGLLLFAGRWLDAEAPLRLGTAVATAVLTGAAASGLPLAGTTRLYGAWVGIGCSVALVLLEAVGVRSVGFPARPSRRTALRAGAALSLAIALFLPWQEEHFARFGAIAAWQSLFGAVAGVLALALLLAPLLGTVESYALDVTLAIALLVATLGFVAEESVPVLPMAYGAYVGFATAALLVLFALARLRRLRVERGRALPAALPFVASVACLAAILLPLWYVLPDLWTLQATPVQGWLAVAALLLALYLLRAWALRVRGLAAGPRRLTLVPLALLVLPALQLIRYRDVAILWGGLILVGLCLLLSVLGWIEESGGGLEHFRLPESLRLDRLPGVEG